MTDLISDELQDFLLYLSQGAEFEWEIHGNKLIITEDRFNTTDDQTRRTYLEIEFSKIFFDNKRIYPLDEFLNKD